MKLVKDCKSFFKFLYPITILIFLSSCATSNKYSGITIVRKYQKNIPFVFKNNISLNAEMTSKDELTIMKSRLNSQLDDSSRVKIKDIIFFIHSIKNPPVFDITHIKQSALNMNSYMQNMGYYNPEVTFSFDTVKIASAHQERVIVNYNIKSGKRTVIDTLAYLFNQPELQQIAVSTKKNSELKKGTPVTKTKIIDETNRLVNLFRNYGYYKFTADEIRVTGDTTIQALTSVSEDPFEQLRLLAEAAERRNKPSIRLGYQLNNPSTADTLKKYFINNIYIYPDYNPSLSLKDTFQHTVTYPSLYTILFHEKKIKNKLFQNNIFLKKGAVFRQQDYYKTINELYKLGVWESPSVDITESKDTNTLNLSIKLIPLKKYAFQGNVELSYSVNSNTTNLPQVSTGNLFGVSANLSLTDRNFAGSAIRMTNSVTAGAEFNTSRRNSNGTLINSREISFNNSFIFPKFIFPLRVLNNQTWVTHQTFINTNISFINRIDFFNQQIINTSYGFNFTKWQNRLWSIKLINFDFRRLYNRSAQFDNTLHQYPYLRYSFNTALVLGSSVSYTLARPGFRNQNAINKLIVNLEESGLPWGFLREKNRNAETGNFFNKYLRQFVKGDIELTRTITHLKSSWAFRAFGGIGVPISKTDTTLPFFKQYFGGGPNSMRGWPAHGIGVGGQALAPYSTNTTLFNDRTGDIQLEGNIEYRFNVAPLFSNALMLKMALFTDVGNIWNLKNTRSDGQPDTTQFHFKNLYKQLGVSSGVGFRFDFGYFLVRFDMAFRFKRPDLWYDNAGWQLPSINFKNLIGSDIANKIWRYQNFNATIGIDYPF